MPANLESRLGRVMYMRAIRRLARVRGDTNPRGNFHVGKDRRRGLSLAPEAANVLGHNHKAQVSG